MAQLQFISHTTPRYSYLDSIRLALEGGCRWVQLRMKEATPDELRRTALAARELCRQAGPFRFTTTKQGLSPILGLDGYRRILAAMREEGISLPLVAIGGIGFDDIPALLEAGCSGIALSGSVLRAVNPVAEMKKIVELLNTTP